MSTAINSHARERNTAGALIIDVDLQLRGRLAAKLQSEAKKRGVKPGDLLADVIELVITDNLFEAVIG